MASPVSGINVEGVGRVMATLDDVRLLLYVSIVLVLLLCGFVAYVMRTTNAARAAEREDIAKKEERIWQVADKFTDAATHLAVELAALRGTAARIEANHPEQRG